MSICGYCGCASKEILSKCSKCKQIHYCNKNCQKNDWSRHKPECSLESIPSLRYSKPQWGDLEMIANAKHEDLLRTQKKVNEYISSTRDFEPEKRFETNHGSTNVFMSLIQDKHMSIDNLRKVCEKLDLKNSDLWCIYKEICNESYTNTSKVLTGLLDTEDFMNYIPPSEYVNYFRKPEFSGSFMEYLRN